MPQSLSDLDVIKRAHLKTDWTETTLQELLNCGEDPLYFMELFMRIQHPTRGAIPFNAYIYQKRMVAAMQAHRFSILMTGRQLGKALALTTPIATPNGWTTMGDLRVGDQVYGSDGLPTTITFATDTMLDHECFEVEFDNGEIIIADAEHLWRVEFGSSARIPPVDTITTRDLIPCLEKSKKRGQGVRIKLSSPLNTPEADLPVPPYTLGVWLGDGNSADGRFCGHKDDCLEMRDHVAADGFHPSEIKSDPRNNVQLQTIYGLRGRLVEAGVFKNKHIPKVYLRASIAQRLELLRGLMDTDGYADRNGGMEFYQKDFQFTLQVFELIASLGMKPRWASKLINGTPYHRVRFATTKHEVFKLARKQQIAEMTQGHQKNDHYYIRDIRPSPSVPVRCIQVDNQSHMYLCGRSMIPTHNTTCAAGYLTWKAMFVPDSTILVVANKFTQALEVMERVRYCYENLPNHIRAGVTEYNKSNISFDNGSRIIARATSADAGRGLAVSLLYCDEFAFVPPNKQKEFWTSIQPTLAEGGSCIITSTPKNDEDIFAQIWKGAEDNRDEYGNEIDGGVGRNGFFAVKVPWYEHPDRDEEWARPWRESLGEARFRQEFELDWVSDDETLINPLTLSRMIASPPTSYTGTVRWYHDPQPNHGFLVALDPAMGTERNYGAIEVFQMPEMI